MGVSSTTDALHLTSHSLSVLSVFSARANVLPPSKHRERLRKPLELPEAWKHLPERGRIKDGVAGSAATNQGHEAGRNRYHDVAAVLNRFGQGCPCSQPSCQFLRVATTLTRPVQSRTSSPSPSAFDHSIYLLVSDQYSMSDHQPSCLDAAAARLGFCFVHLASCLEARLAVDSHERLRSSIENLHLLVPVKPSIPAHAIGARGGKDPT